MTGVLQRHTPAARARAAATAVGLLAALTACAPGTGGEGIVVTTNILGDITREVVGGRPRSPS